METSTNGFVFRKTDSEKCSAKTFENYNQIKNTYFDLDGMLCFGIVLIVGWCDLQGSHPNIDVDGTVI